MKYVAVSLFFWLMMSFPVRGQDMDIYHHKPNAGYKFPAVPKAMTFREFDLLSTNVRMQDIFASTVMPGYIHFRIYEKRKGYWLLGLRSLGYAGYGYLALQHKSWWNLVLNPAARYSDPNYKVDVSIAYVSAGLVLGTFLYDWIHGRYILQRKKSKIRFKYAPVVSYSPVNIFAKPSIHAGVAVNW